MVSDLSWGIMATTSTLPSNFGNAFGNPQSHAEVDGTPYFYVSELDQSMKDVATNPFVSYTLSNGQKATAVGCGSIQTPYTGDPESPICSRLTLMGSFVNVSGTEEGARAQTALLSAHPAMASWPDDHSWFIGALRVNSAWLINIYGGATELTSVEYYGEGTQGATN